MKATVINAWQDAFSANLAMVVAEKQTVNGKEVVNDVEYIVSIPLTELEGLKESEVTDLLIEAAKAKRNEQIAPQAKLKAPKTIDI